MMNLASVIAPGLLRESAEIMVKTAGIVVRREETVSVETAVRIDGTVTADPIGMTETDATRAVSVTTAVAMGTPTDTETLGTGATEKNAKNATNEATDAHTGTIGTRSARTAIGVTDTTGSAAPSVAERPTETADAVQIARTAARAGLPSAATTVGTVRTAGTGTAAPTTTDAAAAGARTSTRSGVILRTVTTPALSPKKY